MLNQKEIQRAILDRLHAMDSSCNSTHIVHNDGVLRGLLWTLTGTDPGTNLSDDVQQVLDLAGFETKRVNGKVEYEWQDSAL